MPPLPARKVHFCVHGVHFFLKPCFLCDMKMTSEQESEDLRTLWTGTLRKSPLLKLLERDSSLEPEK